jgi:hypothetical protein
MVEKNKKAQAWIETVVYTLIMLSIIGIVVAVAKPALEEKQDKLFVEQSIETMNIIDSKIGELIVYGPGNTREISELGIKKGKLTINCPENIIEFEIDSKYAYSQPDIAVQRGDITIFTEKKANYYKIKLSISYDNTIDITYNNNNENKTISSAPTPYKLYIRNANYNSTERTYQMDFSLA